MRKIILSSLFLINALISSAQNGSVVLIEEFTETGCGACSQYDSSFQALTDLNADKVAVINFHCYYALDTFYMYNMSCDRRYSDYKLSGYPCATANGMKGIPSSGHLAYINQQLIDRLYNQEQKYKLELMSSKGKSGNHSVKIKVNATALKDVEGEDIRLFVVVTENNIDHEKRYNKKATNGINKFNHIMRAFLPNIEGTKIGKQKKDKVNTVAVNYTNDDKEINFKEVQIVAFVQDMTTMEVLGAMATKEHPFK